MILYTGLNDIYAATLDALYYGTRLLSSGNHLYDYQMVICPSDIS
ncbi:hypothetical protein [Erysipelothrix tonsillarum]